MGKFTPRSGGLLVCVVAAIGLSISGCQSDQQPTAPSSSSTAARPTTTVQPTTQPTTTPSPAPPSAGKTIGSDGIGKAKLGMTKAAALATGAVKVGTRQVAPYELAGYPSDQSYPVCISEKLGVALITVPDDMRTREGIRKEATQQQVEAAYPKLEKKHNDYFAAPVPGNPKAIYLIEISGGTVAQIMIALADQDCLTG
ncbi:hypothetical protein EV193_11667 [Herbihabitans rhizosphaerae]|uniref:Uncharacterized protein n=1 Tax=Herbihabitans rhizosphaerae TaxID=1872711 RepID=A0A4Q7KCX5_9PSEU|nr:hypothetical protein [Herbihabitans rhizosphaerae]RZS30546.1 hypothetical protein EV193_11667 [Herbihabitans rhizosphaerae]